MSTKFLAIPLFSILFILVSCSSPTKSVPDKSRGDESDDSDRVSLTTTRNAPVEQKENLQEPESEPLEFQITKEGFIQETEKVAETKTLKIKQETSRKRKKKKPGKSRGGMAPKVTSATSFEGVDPNKLRNFMKKNRKHINECFRKGKAEDANISGVLKAKFKINAEGKVDSCKITQHLDLESVGNCVCTKIKTWNFPVKSKDYDMAYFWQLQ